MISRDFVPTLPYLPGAACKDIINPDIFFPRSKKTEAKSLPIVQSICSGCPVRKECLDFALDWQIPHGIWAGTTPAMRDEMLKGRLKREPKESVASRIIFLHNSGRSTEQIASLLNTHAIYVRRVIEASDANGRGAIQSTQQINDSLKGFSSSSEFQR